MLSLPDPQLDTNFLIRLRKGEHAFMAYAQANHAFGLCCNLAVQEEFLVLGTQKDLDGLERQYGLFLIDDVTLQEIDATALRLQSAFDGDPWHRKLREADARVAATVFLKNGVLATGDLHLFKRVRDLGLGAAFVGDGPAVARATAYSPRPVTIP